MPVIRLQRQTPYCLLANNIAANMLKDTPKNIDPAVWRKSWENITEKDYTVCNIRRISGDMWEAKISFHHNLLSGPVMTTFKTVGLSEFLSYMAVKNALEKSHTNLLTETYLRRNGTQVECVVPKGYDFSQGFPHNDWLFPADMFDVQDDKIFFHPPIIIGWARIIYL